MLLNINDIIIFIIVTIGFSWNKMSQMNKYIQIRKLTGIGNTKYIWISFLITNMHVLFSFDYWIFIGT